MTTIESSVPGNKGMSLSVIRNSRIGVEPEEVFIRRIGASEHSPTGIVFTQWEAYKLIEAIVANSGIKWEPTAAGTGIILQAPEDPTMGKRRDGVAVEYFDTYYLYLESDQKRIVDRVVELEQKVGEL